MTYFQPTRELLEQTRNGIIFSPELVSRVFDDTKTVTRRMSRAWLKYKVGEFLYVRENWALRNRTRNGVVITYEPSAALRAFNVRHEWSLDELSERKNWLRRELGRLDAYREKLRNQFTEVNPDTASPLRPSLLLPRWAARMVLRITEPPRLERLQDITEEDAKREGVPLVDEVSGRVSLDRRGSYRLGFRATWMRLHREQGERWEDNPEVVRIAFERVTAWP